MADFTNQPESSLPTTRVRNARTGRWVELPAEIPGHAYHHGRRNKIRGIYLCRIETIQTAHRESLKKFDRLSRAERHEENYPIPDLTTPPAPKKTKDLKPSDFVGLF